MSRPHATEDVFRAIADGNRRTILNRLAKRGELTVNDIAHTMPVTLSTVSQHLQILRETGLVKQRRRGTKRYYRADLRPLRCVQAWLGATSAS